MSKRQEEYSKYLSSDLWKKKRAEILKQRNHRCEMCESILRLQVHHGTYKRIGNERDEDLFVMCRACHKDIHKHYKRLKYIDLMDSTLRCIANAKVKPVKISWSRKAKEKKKELTHIDSMFMKKRMKVSNIPLNKSKIAPSSYL